MKSIAYTARRNKGSQNAPWRFKRDSREQIESDLWGLAIEFMANVDLKSDGSEWQRRFAEILDRMEGLKPRLAGELNKVRNELDQANDKIARLEAKLDAIDVFISDGTKAEVGMLVEGEDGKVFEITEIRRSGPFAPIRATGPDGEDKRLKPEWLVKHA